MDNLKKLICIVLFTLVTCTLYAQPRGGSPATKYQEKDGSPSLRSRTVILPPDVISQDTGVSDRIELLLVGTESADNTYLRLDTTNDPLTGDLTLDDGTAASPELEFVTTTQTHDIHGNAGDLVLRARATASILSILTINPTSPITLFEFSGSDTGNPLAVKLKAGDGVSPGQAGSDIYLAGGDGFSAFGDQDGGDVNIVGGAKFGAGTDGSVIITGTVDWTGITGGIDIGSNAFVTTGNMGIGGAAHATYDLDILGPGVSNAAQIRLRVNDTNSSNQNGGIALRHFLTAEEDFLPILFNTMTSANTISIGGDDAGFNAATQIGFYTAANNTTLAGTLRYQIDSSGDHDFQAGSITTTGIGTDSQHIITKDVNGGDVNLIISNTAGGGSSDETVTLFFKHKSIVGGKIVCVRENNYGPDTENSGFEFWTTSGGSNQLALTLDSNMDAFFEGNLTFEGNGKGLPFAEIYARDNTTTTSTSTTKIQILIFDTNGQSNNMTPDHAQDHITVVKAGMYKIDASISIKNSSGSAHVISLEMYKNDGTVVFNNIHAGRTLGTGTDVGNLTMSGIVDLAVDDTIEFWITSDSGAARTVTVEDIDFSAIQIGGT